MEKVDADNAAYLKKDLREFGWLDVDRFGTAASNTALLIVQHCDDLPLMQRPHNHHQYHDHNYTNHNNQSVGVQRPFCDSGIVEPTYVVYVKEYYQTYKRS